MSNGKRTALALRLLAVVAGVSLLGVGGGGNYEDRACGNFSWNVDHERALFRGAPLKLTAAQDAATAPELQPDRLYALALNRQEEVHLLMPPGGKKKPSDTPFAGLVHLQVPSAGLYRIALGRSAWVDVLSEQHTIAASDFTHSPVCYAPHKVVEFTLPAGELVLELTGATSQRIELTLTRAPPAKDEATAGTPKS